MSVTWKLIAVLFCIFLIISDVEPLSHVLFGHLCVFFRETSLQVLFVQFWISFFFFLSCWVLGVLYIFEILIPYQISQDSFNLYILFPPLFSPLQFICGRDGKLCFISALCFANHHHLHFTKWAGLFTV